MTTTDVLIVGAGQAGLALGHCLARSGIETVLVERGRVGERWRSERWDSLRLLTPNWMTRLPGRTHAGDDPDAFMAAGEVAAFLGDYAAALDVPILTGTRVLAVFPAAGGYRIETDGGAWRARAVVVATGACERPAIPEWAAAMPADVHQVAPARYRRPADLPEGGVLIVGASATGVQLAAELAGAGREVTLTAGRHRRLPRRYRGRDIMDWMVAAGVLDDAPDSRRSAAAMRRQPSLQLEGAASPPDLGRLQALGVRITGRALGVEGGRVALGANLARDMAEATDRLGGLLDRIDMHVHAAGIVAPVDQQARHAPPVPATPKALDLRAAGIRSVIWATGYRRSYDWLRVPVLDDDGEIAQAGGVTLAPGLFAIGLPFMRRRSSTFIYGSGRDAGELAPVIAAYLARPGVRAA